MRQKVATTLMKCERQGFTPQCGQAPAEGSYHSLIVNKSDNGNYVQKIAIKESNYEVF